MKQKLRCPHCFGKRIRTGESPDLDDDVNVVYSMEFDILQCKECGWAGDKSRFVPPAAGLAEVSPCTEKVINVSSQLFMFFY